MTKDLGKPETVKRLNLSEYTAVTTLFGQKDKESNGTWLDGIAPEIKNHW